MNALLCIRLPSEEARKDFLDATFKHNAPFVLSIEPDDIVSFVKKDPKEDGSAKIAHPMNSMDQVTSTGEPIRLPFTPVGYPNTNEFGHVQAQVSSVTNALEMSQASDFSFRQAQAGNTIIQNAFFSSSGPSVFDREQQEAPIFTTSTNPFRSENVVQDTHSLPIHPADSNGPDDLVADPVVKEEFEQSNAAKQANSSSIFSEASPTTPMTRSFYRQVQAKDTVGNAAVESIFQQNDYEMYPIGLFAPDAVVKEECDQSVNQVPPPLSLAAHINHEEPYDIFQDIKPQHIDLDQPRVVVAEIDMTKDSDSIKKEDLDNDLDEEMEEETQKEVHDEEDSSDAGEHLDAKDKAYTPKSRSTISCGSSSFDHDSQHRSIFTSSDNPFRNKRILSETNFQPVYFDMETIRPTESNSEPVVKEEVEESSRVKQALPPSFPPDAPLGQEEPYDIFQDGNPQVIDSDMSCIGISAIDLMKDPDMLKREDLDEDLDEGMQQETQEEKDGEDYSDAGEHLDSKDKAYTPKGSSSKKKQHLCEVCQKVFNDTRGLRRHLSVHTGEKAYQCDVCQKHFRTKQQLTYHLRVHTGEKPYSCEVCQNFFTSRSSHKRHMLIHSGEKPFSCDVCKKTFRVKGTLQGHMRSHTGEKPHECKDCDEKFSYLKSLKIHRIRCHT